jgi:hypothetical protein
VLNSDCLTFYIINEIDFINLLIRHLYTHFSKRASNQMKKSTDLRKDQLTHNPERDPGIKILLIIDHIY